MVSKVYFKVGNYSLFPVIGMGMLPVVHGWGTVAAGCDGVHVDLLGAGMMCDMGSQH